MGPQFLYSVPVSDTQVAFFTISAQRQTLRIRHSYFRALVRQEMAFYDREGSGGLSSRIASDIPKIQEAIGDKLGGFLQYVRTCLPFPPGPGWGGGGSSFCLISNLSMAVAAARARENTSPGKSPTAMVTAQRVREGGRCYSFRPQLSVPGIRDATSNIQRSVEYLHCIAFFTRAHVLLQIRRHVPGRFFSRVCLQLEAYPRHLLGCAPRDDWGGS